MTSLVTGASGFIGRALVARLASQGDEVLAVTRGEVPRALASSKHVKWLRRDLHVQPLSQDDVAGAHTVFHLAAQKELRAGEDERAFVSANEVLTLALLQATSRSAKRFIFASSQMVYGNPGRVGVDETQPLAAADSTAYACSKLNAENWLRCLHRSHAASMTVLRLCGFVEGGGNIDQMIDSALRHEPIELFQRGVVRRDYLSLENGVDALIAAATVPQSSRYEVYNIGSGEAVTTHDMARAVCAALESRSEILLSEKPAPRGDFVFDIAKARRMLAFRPAPLLASVQRYARERKAAMTEVARS